MKITLEQIHQSAEAFAAARNCLIAAIQTYDDAVQLAKDKHWPGIRELAGDTAIVKNELANLIDHARDLFDDPRTISVDGIKLGLRKAKGSINFADEDKVIELIGKHFPERRDEFIKTERFIKKKALETLSAADLKRIGVTVTADSDEVVIAPASGGVDKLVAAVLKEASPE